MKGCLCLLAFLFCSAATPLFAGNSISCPVVADAWVEVPAYDALVPAKSPASHNHGADPQLSVQGYLSFAMLQFDVAAVKGHGISKATLRLHQNSASPAPLHTVGISTISGSGPWVEGTQQGGPASLGSMNFYFARAGELPWAFPGSDLVNVTFGQGGSLYTYERIREAGAGWFEVDLSADMANALASGDQYGLVLCDEKGQMWVNHLLDSRESPFPPVLLVELAGEDRVPPGKVKSLLPERGIADSTPQQARRLGHTMLRPGSVILQFGGAGDDLGKGIATRYEVRYSEKPITAASFDAATRVPRWSLDPLAPKTNPLAVGNALQDQVTAVVEQLKPGAVYYFAARAFDKAGNAGPVSLLGRYRAYHRTFPSLPNISGPSREATPPTETNDSIRVWAVPDLMKINPRTGALLEQDFPEHRRRNSVWDAARRVVKLTGARNEFVAFQLAVESPTPVSGVQVKVSQPLFVGNKLPGVLQGSGAIQISREWFIPGRKVAEGGQAWYPDALVPLDSALAIPAADNGVPGQTVQPFFVDLYIPHDASPGKHLGKLRVQADGVVRKVTVEVEVLPLTLPNHLNFSVDLNCYSAVPTPEGVVPGTPEYRRIVWAYYRLAHEHRATLDILGYHQTGGVEPDNAPQLEGEGAATRARDWRDWDAHFGPLLDGSAFSDLPRGSVPLANMYLPFFENWPGDFRSGYRFVHPLQIKTEQEYRSLIARHALEAGPVEEAFTPEYQERVSAAAREFARHLQERGWTNTRYFYYFNNKYYFKDPKQGGQGSSLWLLDEPNHRDDARALSFLANLVKRGLKDYPQIPIRFRTDISRVEWIRDLLANQIDLNCVSQKLFDRNRYLLDDRGRFGREYWQYGTTNDPSTTNVSTRAWCWRAWLNGADGIVPWNAVAGMRAWERPSH